jgi:hypothetical protein
MPAFGPGMGSGCFCLQPSAAVRATNAKVSTQNVLIGKLLLMRAPLASLSLRAVLPAKLA